MGSIAFDSVETPFGSVERELGGSAVYSALAASRFTQVRAVGPVGHDFSLEDYDVLEGAQVDTGGIQGFRDSATFSWRGRYDFSLTAESLETNLNVFDGWRPRLATEARQSSVLFLAAMDPEVQLEVRGQATDAGCVALDSMTYWIRTKRDALVEAIRGVDIVMMNDHEARELTGQPMLLKAAQEIASWGPRAVALRLGEYGCVLWSPAGFFSVPGYPLERATDPTGSGDAFAGGFLGYLDLVRGEWDSDMVLRRAITYGCVMSSFCYEDFGVRRLAALTRQEIDYRFTEFRHLTHFEHVPESPRARDLLSEREHPALERPAPTPTTGPRQAPPPSAGTRAHRAPGPTPSTQPFSPPLRQRSEPLPFRRAQPTLEPPPSRITGLRRSSGLARFPRHLSPTEGRTGDPTAGSGRREDMLYCVVAGAAPRKVREALAHHFEDDPTVSVVVERRGESRRSDADRRTPRAHARARISERRAVRHPDGRRVAERRAVLGPVFRELSLPRAARNHAADISFGTRIARAVDLEDDVVAARLALAHQAGDTRAFEGLYAAWFDRAYTFFRAIHAQPEAIEDAVNAAFTRAFDRLGDFLPTAQSFRAWFGAIAAETAADQLQQAPDLGVVEPRIVERWDGPTDLEALSWLQDDDLILLLRQLSWPQREVVALQYIFGLGPRQVGEALELTAPEIGDLHERALRFMAGCLTSLSRRPGFSGRLPMRERRRYYPVTAGRKKALVA